MKKLIFVVGLVLTAVFLFYAAGTGIYSASTAVAQEKKGEMKQMGNKDLDKVRSELGEAKKKLAREDNYSCCISPSCNFCALAMNMCPCGNNVSKGDPVCGECKGGWMTGYGAIEGIKAEDVKTMPPDKMKMAYEMRAKMMLMSKSPKKK